MGHGQSSEAGRRSQPDSGLADYDLGQPKILGMPIEIAPTVLGAAIFAIGFVLKQPSVQYSGFLVALIAQSYAFTRIVKKLRRVVCEKIDGTAEDFLRREEQMLKAHTKVDVLSGKDAELAIQTALGSATKVKNTYVNISDAFGTGTHLGESSLRQYQSFLAASEHQFWDDITTYADIYQGRFRALLNSEGELIGQHRVTVIDGETDVINFLIAEEDSDDATVFFGWIKSADQSYRVFKTKDVNIVNMFRSYFVLLQSRPIEGFQIDYRSAERVFESRADKFVGRWLAINLPQEGISKISEIERYSILTIKHKSGSWHMEFEMFDRQTGVLHGEISTDMVVLEKDTIVYRYRCEKSGQIDTGIGSLNLLSNQRSNFALGRYCRRDATRAEKTISKRIGEPDIEVDVLLREHSVDDTLQEIIELCQSVKL